MDDMGETGFNKICTDFITYATRDQVFEGLIAGLLTLMPVPVTHNNSRISNCLSQMYRWL